MLCREEMRIESTDEEELLNDNFSHIYKDRDDEVRTVTFKYRVAYTKLKAVLVSDQKVITPDR